MIWLVLFLALCILIEVSLGKKGRKEDEGGRFFIYTVLVVVGLSIPIITGRFFSKGVYYEYTQTPATMIAFKSNSSYSGNFVLATGSVDFVEYYQFYTKDEKGGIRIQKVLANSAVIYEEDRKDGLFVTNEKSKRKWYADFKLWYIASPIERSDKFEFHVPRGTVVQAFKAN